MKIRNSFVSNSSSASFVLKMGNLTDEQISTIESAMEKGAELPLFEDEGLQLYNLTVYNKKDNHKDYWTCVKHPGELDGHTSMDNGYLSEWFEELGIPESEYTVSDDSDTEWDYEDTE